MRIAPQLCVVLTVAASLGQTPPKDVDGWGKIKWGMGLPEVRAAYGRQAKASTLVDDSTSDYAEKLTVEKITVGQTSAIASIQARRGSDKITQVALHFLQTEATTGNATIRSDLYKELKVLLPSKYGPAMEEDVLDTKTMRWTFPSTSIELRWFEPDIINIGSVTVRYTAVDKKAKDAL